MVMPPRLLRPKDEPGTTDGNESTSEQKGGKRRAVSSACIPCRKRKSKCDGNLPSCSTCIAVYRTECTYDADSDHRRKGALKRDIQSLQQQNDALDVIVASLRSLPESESISLLHSLRTDASSDVIAASLRNNVQLPHSHAPQSLEADFAQQISQCAKNTGRENGLLSRSREHSFDVGPHHSGALTPSETPATWFRVPQDAEFVEHLLNLYFCWVHPFYHFFSRDHFLHDMSRGKTDFCSAMLVNALLSMACHYSDRASARTDPSDSSKAGDDFFAEAKRLLDRSEQPCLTTVQTLAIMSIREASHGRDSNGYQYAGRCVRMCLELGLHLSTVGSGLRSSDVEVRKITFWGVFNLETLCSVAVGRLSQLPRAATDIQKPSIADRTESQPWQPYEDANMPISPSTEQPGRAMLFVEQLSKLSEIASDVVNASYAPQEQFTSRRLVSAYQRYQEWFHNLPDALSLENTSLPHVLVLYMCYYGFVLHLFRPFIKLDLSAANIYPRDTCTSCANEISGLMSALRAMYGLRRVALPVTSLLLSASTIHLLNVPSEQASAHLNQGLHDLAAMSLNHQFAGRCVEIIRALATKWKIALPESAVTVPSIHSGNQQHWPSPPSSTFWAASIPRNPSSGTETRSSASNSSNNDSPFRPPPPQNQAPSYPTFLNDHSASLNNVQTQNPFWTPFPVQTMPTPPQSVVPSMPMDFTPMDSHPQWTDMFSSPVSGPTSNPHSNLGSHPPAAQMNEAMGFEGWQWQ